MLIPRTMASTISPVFNRSLGFFIFFDQDISET